MSPTPPSVDQVDVDRIIATQPNPVIATYVVLDSTVSNGVVAFTHSLADARTIMAWKQDKIVPSLQYTIVVRKLFGA